MDTNPNYIERLRSKEFDGVTITTEAELRAILARFGYTPDESSSFDYTNNLNPGPAYPARSVYIVEADTGLSFANVNARRDENFYALQDFRYYATVIIDGRTWEL